MMENRDPVYGPPNLESQVFPGVVLHTELDLDPEERIRKKHQQRRLATHGDTKGRENERNSSSGREMREKRRPKNRIKMKDEEEVFPGVVLHTEIDADPQVREKKKEEKRIGAEVFPGIVLHTEIDVDPRVRVKKKEEKKIATAVAKWMGDAEDLPSTASIEEVEKSDVFPGIPLHEAWDADPSAREKNRERKKIESTVAKWLGENQEESIGSPPQSPLASPVGSPRASPTTTGSNDVFPGIVLHTETDHDPKAREKNRDKKRIESAIAQWYGDSPQEGQDEAERSGRRGESFSRTIFSLDDVKIKRKGDGKLRRRSSTSNLDPFPGVIVFSERDRDPSRRNHIREQKKREKIEETVAVWSGEEGGERTLRRSHSMSSVKNAPFPGIAVFDETLTDAEYRKELRARQMLDNTVQQWYGDVPPAQSPTRSKRKKKRSQVQREGSGTSASPDHHVRAISTSSSPESQNSGAVKIPRSPDMRRRKKHRRRKSF